MNTDTDFVRDYNLYTENKKSFVRTFTCPSATSDLIRKFCQPTSKHKSQLGVDMTYRTGHFYTTTFTFPHPMLQNSRGIHPTMFGGFMTSVKKRKEDYKYLAEQLKKYCGLKALIYGTDGEIGLEQAFEETFPSSGPNQSVKLRCFDHLKSNLLDKLKECGLSDATSRERIIEILGHESEGIRQPGLVDVKAELFEAKYNSLKTLWPQKFLEYLEDEKSGGASVKTVLRTSMSSTARTAAGLGLPPNKFDNQRTEALHNVVKECIDHQYTNQVQLIEALHDRLFESQNNELVKAVYGKGEYRLSDDFKKRAVSEQVWNDMTPTQRKQKVKLVYGQDIPVPSPEKPVLKLVELSVSPQHCEDNLRELPEKAVQKMWRDAEYILTVGSIVCLPNGTFSVSGYSDIHQVFYDDARHDCNCNIFSKNRGICQHVLAVAESQHDLKTYLSTYQPRESAIVENPRRSGDVPNKKKRRGRNNMKSTSINISCTPTDLNSPSDMDFSEAHHNDKPFHVFYKKNLPKKAKGNLQHCESCGVDFIKTSQEPNDFVLMHEERWVYYERHADGTVTKKHSGDRYTKKYYCIKKECLLRRHPYFWNGLIKIPDTAHFGAYRMQVLQQQLDYSL